MDLKSVMDEYREPFKQYEMAIEDLKKEVKELRQTSQVALGEKDDFADKFEKLKEQT